MVTDVSAVEAGRAARRRRAFKAASAYAALRSEGPVGQVFRFTWHFVQMAVVMELGMYALGPVLSVLGQSDLGARSPEASALAMTASMVVPMAAYMRIRGHSLERTGEMSAAMSVPTIVLAAFSLIELLPHSTAKSAMDVLMWSGMLAAMLFRWREYAQHHHGQVAHHG